MKLYLAVQSGALSGQRLYLGQQTIVLGRASDCNLSFHSSQDTGVSSHHAVIEPGPDGFSLIDQDSTNGTLLNGQVVSRSLLRPGDLIQLGRSGPQMKVIQEPGEVLAAPIRKTIGQLGYYNPEKDQQRKQLGIATAIFLTGILFLILMMLFISTIGFVGAFIGTIAAFLPAPFYLLIYLWMDRYDPEPPWALAGAFAWGALFAILVSFVVNTLFGSIVAAAAGESAGLALSAIISAPLIEEFTKGLGVVLIFLLLRKEFDGILDGIVYAGITGLGFATVENVLYYGRTFTEFGLGALLVTQFLRGVLSPFIHSFFTAMTGIGVGIARESHDRTIQILMPIAGFVVAVSLHSLWNLSSALMGRFFFVIYLIIWFPLFLAFLILIVFMAVREKRIIRRTLAFEVGGLLTQPELQLLSSLTRRIRWILAAKNDWRKLQARRRWLTAATKLAFCYWHVERAAAANTETISRQQIPRFRSEIAALKAEI
jgi:RsiW-degrading membrane proteinase PrsW (M82 family)